MTTTPREVELSVVIPMRDAATTIGAQLEALAGQSWPGSWEVVVADNGSHDGGEEMVAAFASGDARFRLVDASAVPGPSAARNAGAAAARGHLLAFCDADDVVDDGWMAAIVEGLHMWDAVTGPQEQDRLNPPWLAGVFGRALGEEGQWFEGIFPYGPSANLGIRRSTFEALGGFDESLAVGEDLDLCLRLWHQGARLGFAHQAIVHYRNRPNLRDLFRQAIAYGAAGPMIVRRLDHLGSATPSRTRGLRSWLWLLRHLHTLRSRSGRARWVAVAGRALGRVGGSVRHRALFL